MLPYSTALPKVDCLNNLANWSRHLAVNTKFAPILWVNEDVFREINSSASGNTNITTVLSRNSQETYFHREKFPGHVVASGNANIKAVLPSHWQESYDNLAKTVGEGSIAFWQERSKNVMYDNSRADIRVLVVNIESFFEFQAKLLPIFKTVLEAFKELIAEKFFVTIKDFTVNFLISLLGGFYFDLDFKPKLHEPFFKTMDCVKNAMRSYYNYFELIRYGKILTLLKHDKNHSQIKLDIGMKVNVGEVIDMATVDQLEPFYEVSEEEKVIFRKQAKEFRELIAASPHQMMAMLFTEEKLTWFNLYQKDPNEVVKELEKYEKENMTAISEKIELSNKYYQLLFEALDDKIDCIYNHQFKEEFQNWLKEIYAPFYDFHFGRKFSQVDANVPSRYFYLGYHIIEEEVQAGKIVAHYVRRCCELKNSDKKNRRNAQKIRISLL